MFQVVRTLFVSLLSVSAGQSKQGFKGDTQAGALCEGTFDRPRSCLQDPRVGVPNRTGWGKEVDSQRRDGERKGGVVCGATLQGGAVPEKANSLLYFITWRTCPHC